MDARIETQRRRAIAQSLIDPLENVATAAYIGGSVAYAADFSVNPLSDLDLVVLTHRNRLISTAKLLGLDAAPEVSLATSRSKIDLLWVDRVDDGVPVNVFVYDVDAYQRFLAADRSKITCWRRSMPTPFSQEWGFDGSSRVVDRSPRQFADGWLYVRQGFVGEQYVGTAPRQDLFAYAPISGRAVIDEIIDRSWYAVARRCREEEGQRIVNSWHARMTAPERIVPQVLDAALRREAQVLSISHL